MESIVDKLFKIPKKDKGKSATHFDTYPLNYKQQCDLLYLPHDNGYKYALVVVDVGTRLCDAQPIKNKESSTVVKALEKIYKRDILNKPKKLYFDSGSEFKSDFIKYLESNNIRYRVSKPFRHKQTALAEYKNKIIAKALFKRMIEEEVETGDASTDWIHYLPKVIKKINEDIKAKKPKKLRQEFPCAGDSCDLIPQGTVVRVALDAPKEYGTNKRLHGTFRATDIRWDPKPHVITHTLIKERQPPMYILDNDESTGYTKNQLQIVSKNEKVPVVKAVSKQIVKVVSKPKKIKKDKSPVKTSTRVIKRPARYQD